MSLGTSIPPATEKTVAGEYTVRMEYDISQNLIYLGRARISSATSGAVWQIRKFTYDVNNNPTAILWADGNKKYDNIWDNRGALAYS
jgi:YD repeat-containing protein